MIIILDALIPKPVSDSTVGLPKLPLIFLEEFMRLGRVIEETAPHVLDKVGGPGEKANALAHVRHSLGYREGCTYFTP